MTLTRVTPLDGEAVLPLDDAKLHLRVTHDEEDSLIEALRDAAVSHVERVSGVALAPGTWRWTLSRFPSRIEIPVAPVTAVDDVTYLDADGASQTYADARLVDGAVYPAAGGSWPYAYGSVTVEFAAGLASPDAAPELIAAAKLMLGHLYSNREAVQVGQSPAELPLGVAALIDTYRKVLV